jgi:hypothetical protein
MFLSTWIMVNVTTTSCCQAAWGLYLEYLMFVMVVLLVVAAAGSPHHLLNS